ncbi:MAG: 23S rRNA (adenine(2503)-C(2))-methyltransferase RlmN [Deltaproteobacteria bacterium]|nr:23S rRNA (adenine(2503)-C(2))-methyltransferase RlmN [Deltaproteobacteria bacterium]
MTESCKLNLKGLSRAELAEQLAGIGKERYRADQVIRWLYRQRVTDIEQMSNLSRSCRERLHEFSYIGRIECRSEQLADDGTRKFLFQLEDGHTVETVLINDKNRSTLCLSTQVGCRMGCSFCLTGRSGFARQLSAAEIVDQVIQVAEIVDSGLARGTITNIVLMGMGEPLDNFAEVVKALEIMKYDDGLQFSSRRITLSSCGVAPKIVELGQRIEVSLAISLNAADDVLRSQLMPINRRYNLAALLAACRSYPHTNQRRITFEYILFADLNDSLDDARRLVELVGSLPVKINLIPFNEHPELPFKKPGQKQITAFMEYLQRHHLTVMTRRSKGADISAACGQLREAVAGQAV